MIVEFIRNQKTHIIYGVIVLILASVAYHFFSRKPTEIIKTQVETKVETKVVTKNILKNKIIYRDRVIETKKANGDVITETDHIKSDTEVIDKSNSKDSLKDTITKTEVTKFMNNYSIDVMYPLKLNPTFNALDTQVTGGIRIFDLPIFATVGTDGHFNKLLIGLRLEF